MRLIMSAHAFLWGIPGVVLILICGILLTAGTDFVQLRLLPKAFHWLYKPNSISESDSLSLRRSFFIALGSTVGTGNLIGVCGAICLGGPGSIFWMWVCAFFAMATKYAEASLAVKYRVSDEDGVHGGVMYTVSRGLGKNFRFLSYLYCLFCIFASFGVGSLVQVNAITHGVSLLIESAHLTMNTVVKVGIGFVCSLCFLLSVMDGSKSIGRVCELLVPVAGGAYILLCLFFLVARISFVPTALHLIFKGAFHPRAVTAGVLGSCFRTLAVGCRRGVFSNEGGLGTATMAHAGGCSSPVVQGTMGILEVFTDTIVVCTLTALVVLSSGVPIFYGIDSGEELLIQSFGTVYGEFCLVFLPVIVAVLSFATIVGWGLYGSSCMEFLFGKNSVILFYALQVFGLLWGSISQPQSVWLLAETANALLIIPNLFSLLLLSKEVRAYTKDFYSTAGAVKGGTYANIHQCKPL